MQPGSYNSVPFRLVVVAVSCSEVHLCFALKLAKPPRIPPSNEYNAEMDALECVYSASKNPNDIEVEYDPPPPGTIFPLELFPVGTD